MDAQDVNEDFRNVYSKEKDKFKGKEANSKEERLIQKKGGKCFEETRPKIETTRSKKSRYSNLS